MRPLSLHPAEQPIVTIRTGSRVSAQGSLVARFDDGRLAVRVGAAVLTGWPVSRPIPAI